MVLAFLLHRCDLGRWGHTCPIGTPTIRCRVTHPISEHVFFFFAASPCHFMLHALLFLHHAVVLHPITDRSAFSTGTSPSYTAQAIVFQTFSVHISAKEDRPIFFHLIRNIRAVRTLYVTHSSSGCILGLKVKRIMCVSQRCTIRAL